MVEINDVQRFLKEKNINVPEVWVRACLDHLIAEDQSGNRMSQNLNWIKDQVYDQWLHSDITTLGSSSLPTGLNGQKLIKLSGTFSLQVNEVSDVGTPLYNQLQKIRKDDIENVAVSADRNFTPAWEPKPSRLLKLSLTDGTNAIQGMEYASVPCLSLCMKPGIKILVKGPVEVRRGVMLLVKENVTILGGYVDSILESGAPQNVINRKLNLQEIEKPSAIGPSCINSNSISSTQQDTNETSDFDDFFEPDVERAVLEAEQWAAASNDRNVAKKREYDSKRSLPHPVQKSSLSHVIKKESMTTSNSDQEFDDIDENDFLLAAEMCERKSNDSQFGDIKKENIRKNISTCSVGRSSNTPRSNSYEKTQKSKQNLSFDDLRHELPFQYICHLNFDCSPNKICHIKGFIITLKSKLETIENKWSLTAIVNDGTGACDVVIDDKVLQTLIGTTASEFKVNKLKAKSDPVLKVAITKMLSRCQRELATMCCIFKMEIGACLNLPKVLELIPLTQYHVAQFKNR